MSLNGTGVSVSSAIKTGFMSRGESLAIRVNKTGGTGNIKVQWAISLTGTAVNGSFTGNTSIITTTQSDFPYSAKTWNAAPLPNFLTPFMYLRFVGAALNPATGVTVDAILYKRFYSGRS